MGNKRTKHCANCRPNERAFSPVASGTRLCDVTADAAHLVDYRSGDLQQVPTRNGFGEGLIEAGTLDSNVVGICADLSESTRFEGFRKARPSQYLEIGVSEQMLVAMAGGLASVGKIPWIASYAMFNPGRSWEQVRTIMALNETNVKIAGAHAGVSVGPDGATHQAIEDIAIMRVIPHMTVVVPCDAVQTKKATLALSQMWGPAYLRFGREKSAVITTGETPFEIGKAQIFREGRDVAIVACGILVYNALIAADRLAREAGIECRVVNNHTVKPMDQAAILDAARRCGAVVTVEEHQQHGGMGSRVAEILAQHEPTPIEFIGVDDCFGQSGDPAELIEHYGMGVASIEQAVRRAYRRKRL
ncbi:MAG: transketolase family protein [Candidatus Eremiobacteraeota bacterium]|nr:transketolase family protein [Candidatus Eremiobacteraeota bacterium]